MKKIDVSRPDFAALRAKDALYVDKTEYLYHLVNGDSAGDFFFCSRPRRFGKSLFCSTLDCLFQGRSDLFKGLYIAEKTDYDFNTAYPVVHLNFARVLNSSPEKFIDSFQDQLLGQPCIKQAQIKRGDPDDMINKYLYACKANSVEVVIIIDEFDSPFTRDSLSAEMAAFMRSQFNSFYNVIKNAYESIRFFFMTGVTKLSGLNIFSAMNNLVDITLDPAFAGMFGYTQEEFEVNFAEHIDAYLASPGREYDSHDEFIAAMKDYYDGYKFSPESRTSVYNPISIGKFFTQKRGFRNYWVDTGVSTLAVALAKHNDLLSVVTGNTSADLEAFGAFDITQLYKCEADEATTTAMLYYTGYLTFRDGDRSTWMCLPNSEVASAFTKNLALKYMSTPYSTFASDTQNAMRAGDTESLKRVAAEYCQRPPGQAWRHEGMNAAR